MTNEMVSSSIAVVGNKDAKWKNNILSALLKIKIIMKGPLPQYF